MRELKSERIREMTENEILTKIRELKEEIFNLRFRNAMRQLQNPLLLRERKRDVARMETVLTEHRRGIRLLGAPGAEAPARGSKTAPGKAAPAAKPERSTAKPAKAKRAAKGKAKSKARTGAARVSTSKRKGASKSATSKKAKRA
jgi:large subunit ribosomal protein L29